MTNTNYKKAYLAGGCFWGMEDLFRVREWVIDTRVWYTWWTNTHPTWQSHEWHAEALEIKYDPEITSFQNVLDFFFWIHDPTTKDRQGNDVWTGYRSAIFYQSEEERKVAEEMIEIVNTSGRWMSPVVTSLESFDIFYEAEEMHQDFLQIRPNYYLCHYVRFPSYLK
jgi:peptide-methionine (S)-S-oxide reductase